MQGAPFHDMVPPDHLETDGKGDHAQRLPSPTSMA